MSDCPTCGAPLESEARFCSACGAAADQTSSPVKPAAAMKLGTPGIGIAGFVLSLLGVSLLGIILSWVGYAKAKREGRPAGLCKAGIIIGFAWIAAFILYLASGL